MNSKDAPQDNEVAPLEAVMVLSNEAGLHARSAAALIRTASRFEATVTLHVNGAVASARSLTDILRLRARRGDAIRVQTSGRDAALAMGEITRLICDGFGEA
jgi:phosphocarrier protein FPr/phosphocarrier protein